MRSPFLFSGSFLLAVLIFSACGPSRFIRPLQKGERSLSASLGGPLISFAGTPIPIPNTSFTYGQGISNDLTAFGSLYTTSLAYGVMQIDAGATYRFLGSDSSRWGMSGSAAFNFAIDRWEWQPKLWPNLEANYYHLIGKTNSFFSFGLGSWYELSSQKAHEQQQTRHVMLYPQSGISWQKNKWNFDFQLRWLAPFRANLPNAVSYYGISGNGAVGLYFNFIRRF